MLADPVRLTTACTRPATLCLSSISELRAGGRCRALACFARAAES